MKTNMNFLITSRSFPPRMRIVSDKHCREYQNTHFMVSNFFFPENRAFYEIMRYNILEPGRPPMTIWHTRISRWIPKPTNTHLEYVTVIAFPLRLWLHQRASKLRYSYIACLVSLSLSLCLSPSYVAWHAI